jgi:hypothetical protein
MDHCPTCGSEAVRRCLCGGGELICRDWHVWTWCEPHQKARALRRGETHSPRRPPLNLCSCEGEDGSEPIFRLVRLLALLKDRESQAALVAYAEALLERNSAYDNNENTLRTVLITR